jgi:hypothetical protein
MGELGDEQNPLRSTQSFNDQNGEKTESLPLTNYPELKQKTNKICLQILENYFYDVDKT